MVRFQVSIEINREVADVFSYAADAERYREWEPNFLNVTHEGGPKRGRGARYRFVRKVPFGRQNGVMEIVDFVQDTRIEVVAAAGPIRPRYAFNFLGISSGTRVVDDFTAEIDMPLRLLAPILRRQFQRDSLASLQLLKDVLEGQP